MKYRAIHLRAAYRFGRADEANLHGGTTPAGDGEWDADAFRRYPDDREPDDDKPEERPVGTLRERLLARHGLALALGDWTGAAILKEAAMAVPSGDDRHGDNPAADALDWLWRDVLLATRPDYGPWVYPAQAYRHLLAEVHDLRNAAEAHIAWGAITARAREELAALGVREPGARTPEREKRERKP